MPIYNEEANIARVVTAYQRVLRESGEKYEIILVDDGSTDETKRVLLELAKSLPLKVIDHSKNKGHTQAALSGLRAAKNEIIFYSDSDGQLEPKDFFKLRPLIKGADLVIGWRKERQDPPLRKLFARMLNKVINLLFGVRLHDIDSSFRLIRKQVVDDLLRTDFYFSEGFSAQFTIRVAKRGYKIVEVPVRHYPAGKTSGFLPPRRIFGVAFKMAFDLLRLKRELLYEKTN